MKTSEELLWAEFRCGISDGLVKFMTSDEVAAQVVRRDLREALKAGMGFTTANHGERLVRSAVKELVRSGMVEWLENSNVKRLIAKAVKDGVAKYLRELKVVE